jgi:hypothetical protein
VTYLPEICVVCGATAEAIRFRVHTTTFREWAIGLFTGRHSWVWVCSIDHAELALQPYANQRITLRSESSR